MGVTVSAGVASKLGIATATAGRRRPGRAVRRQQGVMNKTEKAYADHLEKRKLAGEITCYEFDCLKLRLADKTFYTPDFLVQLANDELEIHEVKGFWEDDARVKIKVAAAKYPFRFMAVKQKPKKAGGGWEFEAF